MNYHLKSSRGSKVFKRNIWIVVLIFALILIELNFHPLFGISKDTQDSFSGIETSVEETGSTIFSFFFTKKHLLKEIDLLRDEINSLKVLATESELLKKDNELLRRELELQGNQDLVVAQITMKQPLVPYDTLRINKGAASGISTGDSVLSNGVPVGKIIDVQENTAMVQLISSTKNVIIGNVSDETIEIEGQGNGKFISNVPKTLPVSIDQIIYLNEEPTKAFGVIRKIDETENSTFKIIFIEHVIPLNDLRYVEIKSI